MRANRHLRALTAAVATLGVASALPGYVATAQATPAPVHFELAGHITAGLSYPDGVAVDNDPLSPEYGDVYVADNGNHRVQVLNSSGAFVEMFGGEVNATTKGDICVAGESCQTGANSSAAGQFSAPYSVASDPATGDIYVAEYVFTEAGFGLRVQAFTAGGAFLYELGKEVNTTKDEEAGATEAEKNLCSELEIEQDGECGGPAQDVPGSFEEGSFNFEKVAGNLIAVGGEGANDKLYVGDEHRVQEFEALGGKWVGEISLTSIPAEAESKVQALALDPVSGDLYVDYPSGEVIHRFDPEGDELPSIAVQPLHEGEEVTLQGMAVDGSGRLAVVAEEGNVRPFGMLYDAENGQRVSAFAIPAGVQFARGIGFSYTDELYAASDAPSSEENQEVLVYKPEPIGELTIGAYGCVPGAEHESAATFECTLYGEASTDGVSETEAWFEWGKTPSAGEKTPVQPVAASGSLQAVVDLPPNEDFYYRLSGFDHNLRPPEEPFMSEEVPLTTETVAPHIFGTPVASVVRPSSVVLLGELNPENAHSEYFYQYASSERALAECPASKSAKCAGVKDTPTLTSAVYGRIGAVEEISGLQPGTVYHYRLFVENESRVKDEHLTATSPEGSFQTPPTPQPSVETGPSSGVTSTSATIFGTVDPAGLGTGYAFELGIYNGAQTQYTSVFSGSAGAGSEPVAESYALIGLQPGTTYAYRISVSSGYILNESHTLQGAPALFTTAGAATVLVAPAALPLLATPVVPPEYKPTPPPRKCRRDYKRNKHGVCVKRKAKSKARKAHKAHRSEARRSS